MLHHTFINLIHKQLTYYLFQCDSFPFLFNFYLKCNNNAKSLNLLFIQFSIFKNNTLKAILYVLNIQ